MRIILLLLMFVGCASKNDSIKKSGKLFAYCKVFKIGDELSIFMEHCMPVQNEIDPDYKYGIEYKVKHDILKE